MTKVYLVGLLMALSVAELGCDDADTNGGPSASAGSGGGGGAASGAAGGIAAGAGRGGASSTAGAMEQGGVTTSGGAAGGDTATGGTATGGAAAGAAGAGGSSVVGGPWQGAVSAAVTDSLLQSEYAAWKSAHAQDCGDGSWVIKKDAGSVVSEGIAYGMLLSAAMNDQSLFDGVWKYYNDHLDAQGLMNWATGVCDAPGDNEANAASDSDLDATMALIQASARWGGDYLLQAESLASKVLSEETEVCDTRRVLKPGDAWGGCSDDNGQDRVNPSYFAPGYYKVFAQKFPEQAASWNALADGTYELFAIHQARMDNLVPDWSKVDGSDWYGSAYSYDACRTPWRVAVDYGWSADARAKTFLQNVATWVDGHGGLPGAAQQNNSAFIGAFALAGVYEQAKLDAYVTAWLGSTTSDDKPYFQGTLRVLYLLAAAGKFGSTL